MAIGTLFSTVTDTKPVHSPKAVLPMVVTFFGIVTLTNALHSRNAASPM